MVAREDENVLGIIAVDERNILIDRVCGTCIPVASLLLLVRGQDVYTTVVAVEVPRLTVTDVASEFERMIRYFPPKGTAGFAIFFVRV